MQITVPRGFLSLAYKLGPPELTNAVLDHPHVHAEGSSYLRRGLNIASEVLMLIAGKRTPEEIAVIPYPRAAALAEAVRGLDETRSGDGDIYFTQQAQGGAVPMRLDEIPLPPGTPAASPVG